MTSSNSIRIEIKSVVKRYGEIIALDGANLEIPSKGIFGLLGPNGAGKSTLISCILGLVDYESGEILVDGKKHDPHAFEFKKKLGIVPQELALYDTLSGIDNLKFFGSLFGLKGSDLDDRAKKLLELTGLSDRAKNKVETYSGGMKRRLNLAAGIIHKPEIVLMDEPTVGIDPQSRNLIYDLVESLASDGMTILYTTHYMDEAERLCDRIAIIDQGKIIANGTLDDLIKLMGGQDVIYFEIRGNLSQNALTEIACGSQVDYEDGKLRIKTQHGGARLQHIMSGITSQGCEIVSATIRTPNLEMVFLHLTGKELRD